MATFQLFFQSREQVVVQKGQIQRIGWVIKTLEAQVGQFLLGSKYPVSWSIVMQEQDPLGDVPTSLFLQNVIQLHQQRSVILRVDSSALWKIINEEDAVLITKNRCKNFSSRFSHSEFFGGWVRLYASTPLIVASSPGHSNKPGFVHGHESRQEMIWIVLSRKNPKVAQMFFIRILAFRDPLRRELPHVQIFMNNGLNPCT